MIFEQPGFRAPQLIVFALNPSGGSLVTIKFVFGQLARFESPACFRRESFQGLRHRTRGIEELIGMKTWKKINQRTPCAEENFLLEMIKRAIQCQSHLVPCSV